MAPALGAGLVAGLLAAAGAAEVTNEGWIFKKVPADKYKPEETFELKSLGPLDPVKTGFLRARAVALAVAPAMRGQMLRMPVGQPPQVEQVVQVVESQSKKYKKGAYVYCVFPLQRYVTFHEDKIGKDNCRQVAVSSDMPVEKYLSILSTNAGLTAWLGTEYTETGRVEAPCNKTVVVTSAASATGLIAGQLYKLKGCKVIGITSTPGKAKELKKFGFDHGISYRTQPLYKTLGQVAPEGIDIDFENVGGKQLETIMYRMNNHGRVVLCGSVADYDMNPKDWYGVRAIALIITKRIKIEGIHAHDLFTMDKWDDIKQRFHPLLQKRKLFSTETAVKGFKRWPEAVRMMLDSKNFGKLVVKVDEDEKSEL